MRQKNTNDILKTYITLAKETIPNANNLTNEQIEEMCKSLFSFIKEQMARRDMPVIHIKYFGKFRAFPSTIQTKIIENRLKFRDGDIDEETFKQRDREYRGRLIRVLLDKERNPDKYEEADNESETAD